jgi:ABC-type antimicrobial peptide transport system permease subunit
MIGCVIIGTILSIVAALGPAIRAAKMAPADAMRTEI